jgi:hypothetical protein
MSTITLELVAGNDKKFDNRPYWSATKAYGGARVSCRWVADGEKHMDATQFAAHANRIFDNLDRITGRCTQ